MNTLRFSSLCLLATLMAAMTACTSEAGDVNTDEGALGVPAGVPGGLPIKPVVVTAGKFTLSQSVNQPDPGSLTVLEIEGAASGVGKATVTTTSTTIPVPGEPVITGVPGGLPPFPVARVYTLAASSSGCGKIYNGHGELPQSSIIIYDYRQPGPTCAADIASALFAEEIVNGIKTTWYGKPFTPSNEVWRADATKLVAHTSGGGFTPPPPTGSECGIGAQNYELTIATRRLVWEICEFKDWNTPLTKAHGERTLTQAELDQVVAAAKNVKISNQHSCGADAPVFTMTVTTPSVTTTYKDDFYACWGPGPFVTNIHGVFAAFRDVLDLTL